MKLSISTVLLVFLGIAFSCQKDNAVKLPDGLIASYSFNGNARDCSGNFNDGIIFGATKTADHLGSADGAYLFNGISDHISLPTQPFENNNFSFAIWMRADVLPPAGTAVCIFSIGDIDDSRHQTLSMASAYGSANVTGMSVGGFNSDGTVSSTLTNLPTAGQWYHVTGVRTDTTMSMYVNGTFVASAAASKTNPPYYGTNVSANLGARCTLTQFFTGAIDSFVIFNKAITQQEITTLYQQGNPCQ